LRDLIKGKYPQLSFILVVVKFAEEFEEPWHIEHIRNFSIHHTDVENWGEMFKEVALEFDVIKMN
jgi:hypothetical protein